MARMEDTRLPKCVMFGELMGSTRTAGDMKNSAFWTASELSVSTPTWTTAAQDEEEWRKTAEQGESQG